MSLLRGRMAVDARGALADLSAYLLRLRPSKTSGLSFGGGLSGIAMAHAALERAVPGAGHRARAVQILDRTVAQLPREPLGSGLYGGLAGIGWVLAHLVASSSADDGDPCAIFDEALREVLVAPTWTGPYDLIDGLVGLGVYALERTPRPSSKRLLARVVDHLAASARPRSPGAAWWSDPEWLDEDIRRTPNPDWNLGVAHGVPGVVALLGRVIAADVDPPTRDKARTLLDQAVPWLLAQELPASADGCFAFAAAPGLAREPARLAWCYGDPGVAAALLVAALAAGEAGWEREALRIALRAAARAEATAGVKDASLCHGAAGIAHVFHRIYRATGEKRFADVSRSWFARALAMRTPGRGSGGFLAWLPDKNAKLCWRVDASFLTGAAGIALALVAATTDAEPAWDRTLLLS